MHQSLLKRELTTVRIRPLLRLLTTTNNYRGMLIPTTSSSLIPSSQTRFYASKVEGDIRASDTVFSKKEKAAEDQWVKTQACYVYEHEYVKSPYHYH